MGRYGMAGDHYRQSGYVTLQDVPDPNRVYVESFKNLAGGINRFDLPYHLKGNESPFMQNLSWHNGTLTSRLGQVGLAHSGSSDYVLPTKTTMGEPIRYISAAPFLFHGWLIVQADCDDPTEDPLLFYAVKMQLEGKEGYEEDLGFVDQLELPMNEVPKVSSPGFFYRYRGDVYFKAKGVYIKFSWYEAGDQIMAYSAPASAFVPTIQIDSDPVTGAGNQYQPENRLSARKKIIYNVTAANTLSYQLPITGIESALVYTGNELAERTYYEQDLEASSYEAGLIVLQTAPPVDSSLTIEIGKQNPEAYNAVMDSSAMAVFGGAQDLCVVVGNTPEQPNAYFWSGNNGLVMDPTYFPMNQYNLAGDSYDPITVFGKQQNMLVIFQTGATGRAVFGTETLDGLVQVTMNYTRINAEIGCDLPGSLQLVENNLVWCNRKYGVCRLKDSSAAYENNITVISRKINGDYRLAGLLEQLKLVADDAVRSTDTGKRYILALGDGKAYEWNYELGKYEEPSWFYHTNILGVGFVPLANDELYEVTANGKVATFEPVFSDFGTTAIEKIYDSPPRDFNSYDRVKNIKSMLFTTRGDSKTRTQISYSCDYGSRVDVNDLVVTLPAGATQGPYPKVFRRTPGYHNIHHLAFRLYNNTAGDDLNLISAEIYYEYRGRQR